MLQQIQQTSLEQIKNSFRHPISHLQNRMSSGLFAVSPARPPWTGAKGEVESVVVLSNHFEGFRD